MDSMQEFRVQTNAYDASIGRQAGDRLSVAIGDSCIHLDQAHAGRKLSISKPGGEQWYNQRSLWAHNFLEYSYVWFTRDA